MKQRARSLVPALLLVALCGSGCATYMTASRYPVTIVTTPSQAHLVLYDNEGREIFQGTTPFNLVLDAGAGYMQRGRYRLEISKEGYESRTAIIEAEMEGAYWANLLLGGVIGMLMVDPVTGAMWSLDPIETITLKPVEGGAG